MVNKFGNLAGRRIALRLTLYLLVVLLMGNLDALIDKVFHPEFPYFSEEHLLVGGATAVTTAILLGVIWIYMNRREKALQVLDEVHKKVESDRDGLFCCKCTPGREY